MDESSKIMRPFVMVVVMLFVAILPAANRAHAEDGKETLPSLALEQDLEEAFLSLYRTVLSQVEKNELPEQRSAQADILKHQLEKALIRTDAKIKILRIDIADTAKDQRANLIDQIIQITHQRERLKMIYLLRMHLLAEVSSEDTVIRFLADSPHPKMQPPSTQPTQSGLDIKIQIKPEDITTGERE